MSSVIKLAEEIRRGLKEALPGLRKVLQKNMPLAIGAILESRTANTAMIAARLPLETERDDLRQQWLRRLLSNKFLVAGEVMGAFARPVLQASARNGQTIQLSMDQTDNGERFAVLSIGVRVGDRALPLAWKVESGPANIGFEGQREVLEQVLAWLPEGARVMLSADRFYPSAELFSWLHRHGWQYRLRLKANFLADLGRGDLTTTGALAKGKQERYETQVALFDSGIMTNLGILHEPGHKEPWIIAMECQPTRAKVRDYSSRWCIEPMFSDFKTRGFGLEDTHLENPQRVSNLLLLMSLAMYWCVSAGHAHAMNMPTPTEKKPVNKRIPITGRCVKLTAPRCRGSNVAYAFC